MEKQMISHQHVDGDGPVEAKQDDGDEKEHPSNGKLIPVEHVQGQKEERCCAKGADGTNDGIRLRSGMPGEHVFALLPELTKENNLND